MKSAQQNIEAILKTLPLASEEIQCYGSQVMITARGEATAKKWASVLAKFCGTVRAPRESVDYNKANKNTVLKPSMHTVYRVWATI